MQNNKFLLIYKEVFTKSKQRVLLNIGNECAIQINEKNKLSHERSIFFQHEKYYGIYGDINYKMLPMAICASNYLLLMVALFDIGYDTSRRKVSPATAPVPARA